MSTKLFFSCVYCLISLLRLLKPLIKMYWNICRKRSDCLRPDIRLLSPVGPTPLTDQYLEKVLWSLEWSIASSELNGVTRSGSASSMTLSTANRPSPPTPFTTRTEWRSNLIWLSSTHRDTEEWITTKKSTASFPNSFHIRRRWVSSTQFVSSAVQLTQNWLPVKRTSSSHWRRFLAAGTANCWSLSSTEGIRPSWKPFANPPCPTRPRVFLTTSSTILHFMPVEMAECRWTKLVGRWAAPIFILFSADENLSKPSFFVDFKYNFVRRFALK